MADFITGVVLMKENTIFENQGYYGSKQQIATTSNGGVPSGDFWAIPTSGYGVDTSFTFKAYDISNSAQATAPVVGAVACVKVIQTKAGVTADTWFVVGTSTQYIAGAFTTQTLIQHLPNTYSVNNVNGSGNFFVTVGLPTLGGLKYYVTGYLNGVALTAGTAGFASVGALLTFLNGSGNTWKSVGVWTAPEIPASSGSYTTLTATQDSTHGANNGTDVLDISLYVAA